MVTAHRDGLYKEREAPARVAQERLVTEAGPVAIDGRVAISGGAAAYSAAVLQRHALLLQLRVELVLDTPTQHVRQHRGGLARAAAAVAAQWWRKRGALGARRWAANRQYFGEDSADEPAVK